MRRDQTVRGGGVAAFAPRLGEHVLLVRLEQRELADLLQVALQVPLDAGQGELSSGGHVSSNRQSSTAGRCIGRA